MNSSKGSITLFTTIALMLISASIFTILEGVRYQELNYLASLQTDVAIDAALANYNNDLWENYHLLGSDLTTSKEIIYEVSNHKSKGGGANLLKLKRNGVSLQSYTLLTDGNGMVFINAVSSYMKNNLPYETVKEIYSQYESVKSVMDTSQVNSTNIEKAIENIRSLESIETKSTGTSKTENTVESQNVHSILETAKQWLEMGVLELVLEDTKELSVEEANFEKGVLSRKLNVGKNFTQKEISWVDRIFLQQYLCTYMSHYGDRKPDRELTYEVEYLLEAKNSDLKNLEGVINKLLLVRGAANYLHLISSPKKLASVEGASMLFAGASLNPLAIKIVKTGLLTAWALAESILDVRALLAGKRIAFIKSEEYWMTDLEGITEITNDFVSAKECPWGMEYENYLGIFLLLKAEKDIAMRALQLQESTIRKQSMDESFCMDELMTQVEVSIQYSYNPVFPFLEVFDVARLWEHKIYAKKANGYW